MAAPEVGLVTTALAVAVALSDKWEYPCPAFEAARGSGIWGLRLRDFPTLSLSVTFDGWDPVRAESVFGGKVLKVFDLTTVDGLMEMLGIIHSVNAAPIQKAVDDEVEEFRAELDEL